jgi:hypothetical protein
VVHRGAHRLTRWPAQRGWQITAIEALDLMERYGRSPDDAAPRSVFIEGRLAASVPSTT